jgi:ParB-like chromosome segregation protein Spo0J
MQFKTPDGESFEISTDVWERAGMPNFVSSPRCYHTDAPCIVVPITDVAPPRRQSGIAGFGENGLNNERLCSILTAFRNSKPLPPVEVIEAAPAGSHRYSLYDGMHRYRASAAAGFTHLPINVIRDHRQFLKKEKAAGAQTVRLNRSSREADDIKPGDDMGLAQ